MFSDLPELLWLVIPGAFIGLVVGWTMKYFYPQECENSAQDCRRFSWWVYCLFALMFAGLAGLSVSQGRNSFALCFVGFGLMQFAAIAINHFNPPAEAADANS